MWELKLRPPSYQTRDCEGGAADGENMGAY